MKKSKIKAVTVEFEDRAERFQVDATFSECRNGRKGSELEWTEYHITWVMYDKPKPKPVEPEPEHRREDAWCGMHKCPPGECFRQHNPTAYSGRHQQWDDVEAVGRKGLPAVFKKKVSAFPEFDISDLLEGYGNGSVHT